MLKHATYWRRRIDDWIIFCKGFNTNVENNIIIEWNIIMDELLDSIVLIISISIWTEHVNIRIIKLYKFKWESYYYWSIKMIIHNVPITTSTKKILSLSPLVTPILGWIYLIPIVQLLRYHHYHYYYYHYYYKDISYYNAMILNFHKICNISYWLNHNVCSKFIFS